MRTTKHWLPSERRPKAFYNYDFASRSMALSDKNIPQRRLGIIWDADHGTRRKYNVIGWIMMALVWAVAAQEGNKSESCMSEKRQMLLQRRQEEVQFLLFACASVCHWAQWLHQPIVNVQSCNWPPVGKTHNVNASKFQYWSTLSSIRLVYNFTWRMVWRSLEYRWKTVFNRKCLRLTVQ